MKVSTSLKKYKKNRRNGKRKIKPKTEMFLRNSNEYYGISVPWTNDLKYKPPDKHQTPINSSSTLAKCFFPPQGISWEKLGTVIYVVNLIQHFLEAIWK